MKLFLEDAPDNLIEYLQSKLADFPESVEISKIDFLFDDSPKSRWEQLVLAGQGARLYSNNDYSHSPIYAGKLPKDGPAADLIAVDLNYSRKQRDYFNSFGVTYIGRTGVNPRTILVLDHKKPAERINVHLPESLSAILRDAPDDWWGTMGICSTGNVDSLEKLLNAIPDVIPMVISTGAATKVKFSGYDYVYLNEPKPGPRNPKNGYDMRGRANDLSRRLAMEQTGDWVPSDEGIYVPEVSPSSVLDK